MCCVQHIIASSWDKTALPPIDGIIQLGYEDLAAGWRRIGRELSRLEPFNCDSKRSIEAHRRVIERIE